MKTDQKYRSATLDEVVVTRLGGKDLRRLRRRWPAASKSEAVRMAVRAHLDNADIAERVQTLEMICRALVMMLADHIADGDEAASALLRNRYAQRAIEQGRKLDVRRRQLDKERGDKRTDQGPSGETQEQGT